MRIFWALGYHQAEYYISELSREQLQIDKNATFVPPSGKARSMKMDDIEPMLERGARNRRVEDAHGFGDIAGCSAYGYAAQFLVTPDGGGYWIVTTSGAIIAFGDAKKLGFPQTVGGTAFALLGDG